MPGIGVFFAGAREPARKLFTDDTLDGPEPTPECQHYHGGVAVIVRPWQLR
jgi:hypothetical protein